MIGTDTCAQPGDPIPAALAPIVERSEPRGPRAWQVRCAVLDPFDCRAYAPTKRAALEFAGPKLAQWLAFAGHRAYLCRAVVAAPPPESACDEWKVSPVDRNLDQGDHCPRGGRPTCGDPIVWRLGTVADLTRYRLGWTEERYRASFDRWSIDNDRRNAAWTAALASIEAADLTPDEAAAMRATPETIGYYRLERSGALQELRRRQHPLDLAELHRYWTGERRLTHCWAPTCMET